MKTWIVRFVSLLVFNVVVLLIIGFFTPARVGWSALWAGVVMTALVLWVKPLIAKLFRGMAAKSAGDRTKLGEKLVDILVVLAVAFIVWILTVLLSGTTVGGFFWGYVLPPVIIAIGWVVYDAVDDRIEARAGAVYDRIGGKKDAAAPADGAATSPEGRAGARELQDGLTDEQRRMLDDLG